jgi:hypothetical protein
MSDVIFVCTFQDHNICNFPPGVVTLFLVPLMQLKPQKMKNTVNSFKNSWNKKQYKSQCIATENVAQKMLVRSPNKLH